MNGGARVEGFGNPVSQPWRKAPWTRGAAGPHTWRGSACSRGGRPARNAVHFQTIGGVSPADDGQFHIAAAPFLHQLFVGLVNINGSGTDQGTSVIVNDVEIGLPLDAESCSQRVNGPVRSGAAHGRSVFQRRANGIPGPVGQMVAFGMGVSRGAYYTGALGGMVKRHLVFVAPQFGELGRRHCRTARRQGLNKSLGIFTYTGQNKGVTTGFPHAGYSAVCRAAADKHGRDGTRQGGNYS